jgi:hypothetical protein
MCSSSVISFVTLPSTTFSHSLLVETFLIELRLPEELIYPSCPASRLYRRPITHTSPGLGEVASLAGVRSW